MSVFSVNDLDGEASKSRFLPGLIVRDVALQSLKLEYTHRQSYIGCGQTAMDEPSKHHSALHRTVDVEGINQTSDKETYRLEHCWYSDAASVYRRH